MATENILMSQNSSFLLKLQKYIHGVSLSLLHLPTPRSSKTQEQNSFVDINMENPISKHVTRSEKWRKKTHVLMKNKTILF